MKIHIPIHFAKKNALEVLLIFHKTKKTIQHSFEGTYYFISGQKIQISKAAKIFIFSQIATVLNLSKPIDFYSVYFLI